MLRTHGIPLLFLAADFLWLSTLAIGGGPEYSVWDVIPETVLLNWGHQVPEEGQLVQPGGGHLHVDRIDAVEDGGEVVLVAEHPGAFERRERRQQPGAVLDRLGHVVREEDRTRLVTPPPSRSPPAR